MDHSIKIENIAAFCKTLLNLSNTRLSDEYYYNSLPFCVIDAVFSIGIRYTITRNVVCNFTNKLQIQRLRGHANPYPKIEGQFSNDSLLRIYEKFDINELTTDFFKSRNRTSPTNGILKSEAVYLFSKVLKDFDVNFLQDVSKIIGNEDFEHAIKKIPGQGSGISTQYFYMLAGDDNFIKADRMIIRFIKSCIQQEVSTKEAFDLITGANNLLSTAFPNLTPRILDHEIWKFQKNLGVS